MIDLSSLDLAAAGRTVVSGAPEGHDAYLLGSLVVQKRVPQLLHVCRDDGRMARFASALAFFHPDLKALTFPAWDCLPYDRVSPKKSKRSGIARPAGKTSTMPPRTAYSPASRTVSART